MESSWLRAVLRVWVALVLAFLFVPIVLIVLYAFNPSNIESWPIAGFSLHWFCVAWHDDQVRSAFLLSVRVGLVATALALLLGSAVAYALHKFRFFGREAISFLLVLPLALPGIITGIALNSFFSFTGIQLGTMTIVIGHTTFCIVVVFNNLIARLRRTPGSLAEASQDLGARGWQTLRYVTLPLTATALVSGALLAFALSFDEVIVDRVHRGRAEHAAAVDLRRDPARPAAARGERGRLGRHPAHADPGDPRRPGGGRRRDQPVSPRRRGRRGLPVPLRPRAGLRSVSRCHPISGAPNSALVQVTYARRSSRRCSSVTVNRLVSRITSNSALGLDISWPPADVYVHALPLAEPVERLDVG